MNKLRKSLLLAALSMSIAHQAFADPLLLSQQDMQKLQKYFPDNSSYVWQGNPISIALPLNQEKRIIFPVKVTPDLKGKLTTQQLRIINDDKSLYLTALKPFSTTRMFVSLTEPDGRADVVMIDLSTNAGADKLPVSITLPATKTTIAKNTSGITTSSFNNNDVNLVVPNGNNYITLIRYAWKELFAPARLVSNPLSITRAPMNTVAMTSNLIYGDKVFAHPEISWEYQGTYVTAVELRNKYAHPTNINIANDLCGNWEAASLYPRSYLMPNGAKHGDSTILFLISSRPFGESMGVCNGIA